MSWTENQKREKSWAAWGTLLDIYTAYKVISLWFIMDDGRRIKIDQTFSPYFYMSTSTPAPLRQLKAVFGNHISFHKMHMTDIIAGEMEVYKIICGDTYMYNKIGSFIKKSRLPYTCGLYNMEFPAEEMYMLEKKIFPFCRCLIFFDGEKYQIVNKEDDYHSTTYGIPELRILMLKPDCPAGNPLHMQQFPNLLAILPDGNEFRFPENAPDVFDSVLEECDPDIIITELGDRYIMPRLINAGLKRLNRDITSRYGRRKERSLFSYGQIVYQAGSVYLRGRIHIDIRNSFLYKEVGLDGLIELSRISNLPLQKLGRTSPGTAISSIETKKAFEQNILIPFKKNMPEDFKTADELIAVDLGGLSFRPLVGIHGNVAELDFFSMYPSIMVNYNLSYETINCGHPDCGEKLPVTGYQVCGRRAGIIPQSLKWILERRKHYKKLMEVEGTSPEYRDILDKRQNGLKWLLVVSFGYLGYKNAKFGRIESHESTTAIGRELLLCAKEGIEDEGFTMLHALTDSLWIHKTGATAEDYKKVLAKINLVINEKFKGVLEDGIGFNVKLEGIYRWIAFLPSKTNGVGTANRYYGLFGTGKYKIRGIEMQRRDAPAFIKEFQKDVLDILSAAKDRNEFLSSLPSIDKRIAYYEYLLNNNLIPPDKLIVRKRMSKRPDEYVNRIDIAEASKRLLDAGIRIEPGEKINIIYVDGAPEFKAVPFELYSLYNKPVDRRKYIKLLNDSARAFLCAADFCSSIYQMR